MEPEIHKRKIVGVPLSQSEKEKMVESARREGLSLASWLRRVALIEAGQRKTA